MSAQTPTRPQPARAPLVTALYVFLAALVVTGGLALGAVLAGPAALRTALAWGCGAVAVVVSVLLAVTVHAVRTAAAHRARLADTEAAADLLAADTLPAVVARLRDGASVDTALGRTALPASPAHRRIVEYLAAEVGRSERMRAAAMSACASAAGRVQALATSMLADLREMEHRHGEEVLGDLLKLDHSTAQAGRLADSIAVLTGARSGRRWNKPIAMESILRGAMGRISAYRRIRLHSSSTAAVAGHAAEGVMHALAEIMDNATSFSPPTSTVHVYVEEAQAGVVVSVEDSGLVMTETALRRAEAAVSAKTLDLMSLSGTRLGLAVVGCLAGKHGLTVSFRPSARGGTSVVVLIPQQLITQQPPRRPGDGRTEGHEAPAAPLRAAHNLQDREMHERDTAGPATARERTTAGAGSAALRTTDDRPTVPDRDAGTARDGGAERGPDDAHGRRTPQDMGAPDVPGPRGAGPAPATEYGPSGLPKRRRGQTLAGAPIPQNPPAAGRTRSRSHEESAARLRSFRRAVQGEAPPARPTTPEAAPKDDPR
ncbi:ATP-binding protein [Streptomyces sp. Ru73]|uniref:ATP-binding protein n=1 Tax=Streptomyces sp. Ru73 TaxID=2080748 RepID=UPI000CDDFEE1|nr:ATP-binding protein [Streptomyces sp. Ru73]POX42100.1 ATP-binding protein [Streptomyces sp. Ru73]